MFIASGGAPTFCCCASAGTAASTIIEAKAKLRIIRNLPARVVVVRPVFGASVTPSILLRHSGARAKPASPESIITALEYGFRARPFGASRNDGVGASRRAAGAARMAHALRHPRDRQAEHHRDAGEALARA